MIFIGEGRFKIGYFNDPISLNQINSILKDKKDKFVIPLTREEAKQFKIKGI